MKDYLDTLQSAHGDHVEVYRNPDYVLARQTRNLPKVGLVSGCGAGNAPLCTGYVGLGMLDAACPGPQFGSPEVAQVVAASKAVATDEGVLHIVPHLKGDGEVFQAAADQLRKDGIRVRDVIIDDDIASRDPRHTTGRRALGTVIAAARICGAAARENLHLNRLAQICKQVNINGKSLAAVAAGNATLVDAQVDIGIGLSGEAGIQTVHVADPVALAGMLTERILNDGPFARYVTEWDVENWCWHEVEVRDTQFRHGDCALCLVSSLGPELVCDLDEVLGAVDALPEEYRTAVVRHLTGHLMSAPNPNGISVTLVKMDTQLLKFWDAPVETPVMGPLH